LNSKLAQAALNGQSKMKTGIKYFTHIVEAILETGANNDILAWRQQNPQDFHYRSYELAAIAPDLFDITYYSVEPNFGVNYLRHIEAAKPVFGIQPEEPVRGDLGSRRPDVPNFNIQDQMKNTKE